MTKYAQPAYLTGIRLVMPLLIMISALCGGSLLVTLCIIILVGNEIICYFGGISAIMERIEPNHLTTARLAMLPFSAACLLWNSQISLIACLILQSIIELTDFLDGWLARRYGKQSSFGKFYDPMCDLIVHSVMYLCLIAIFGRLAAILISIIMVREVIVMYCRIYCIMKGVEVAAMNIGKIKANAQMISIFAMILALLSRYYLSDATTQNQIMIAAQSTLGIASAITAYSLVLYGKFTHSVWQKHGF